MGDIGDYWREHKEYKRRREGADRLGISIRQYDKWVAENEVDERLRKNAGKIARCTSQCECGKWLLDTNAHNSHKSVKGRKGHAAKATKEATKQEEVSYERRS